MYYITINVQYVRYSTGRKIKYFIVFYRLISQPHLIFLILALRSKTQAILNELAKIALFISMKLNFI
jgi:hypothetical protein